GMILPLVAGGVRGDSVPKSFAVEGNRYVAFSDFASFYGMQVSGPVGGRFLIENPRLRVVANMDSRDCSIQDQQIWLHEPVRQVRGRWAFHEIDMRTSLDPILRPEVYLREVGHRVVVIDPGHGGADSGARGRLGVEEKRVVLDVARRLRTHLTSAGLTVYMTRESDRFVELEERARMARRWNADLFVSIHVNSAANPSANGAETFVLTAPGFASTATGSRAGGMAPGHAHSAQSAILGYHVQRSLVAQTGVGNRGLRRGRFAVLREASSPAILVECGFVSNPQEEQRFMDPAFREDVARGIARGILTYVQLARQAKGGG
ncbi:MAG TPA: N-acetylmuramoyl-L-alanine amidase, partial [Kiritimatiellia bacterium]|nr:N-acetylmuramoyl-L-alanine amidase [Kiritimatiellia bacterium]